MKNKIYTITKMVCTAFAAMLLFVACNKPQDRNRCNTRIADYLYGVEYDDYDFNACKTYFDQQFIPSGACSEVRRGNFVGRNLDWYINKNASAIIKINHTKDHFASIGMVGCFPQFSNDIAKSGEYSDVYQYLPFKTEDGINECGLYVGVNVMPTGETSFAQHSWEPHAYGHGAAHTNPSASMTCAVNYLPRILLDKASSVEEAMEIIASIDWTEPLNYPHPGETQSFHWLICDPSRSVVLEFIDNEAHYTEAPSVTEPGFGTIMTNFTNCLKEAGIMQINGIGYERFDILYENYKNYAEYPDNFKGMQKLMEQVWFSKAYTISPSSEEFWLSELANDFLPASYLYKNYDLLRSQDFQNRIKQNYEGFSQRDKWYTDECTYWFSTHTSVYNLSNRQLHVLVHEGFDGMKKYYEASIQSKFAKPLNHKNQ